MERSANFYSPTPHAWNKQYKAAARAAPVGKVVIHASKIVRIIFTFAVPFTMPMPKSEPHETWVVDTGNPSGLVRATSTDVTRFAVNP